MGISVAIVLLFFLHHGLSNPILTGISLNIISRAKWGALSPAGPIDPLSQNPAPYVVIHHSGTDSCTSKESCERQVRGIQNYHINNNHWSDIGYTFLVGEDGNIYEGRGWNTHGAHARAYNARSIGICIIGNYTDRKPNYAALEAVSNLIQFGINFGKIKSDYKLIGHRQANPTACPGDKLYTYLQTLPHFEKNPS